MSPTHLEQTADCVKVFDMTGAGVRATAVQRGEAMEEGTVRMVLFSSGQARVVVMDDLDAHELGLALLRNGGL